jgi:hypothetical protein
MSLLEAKVKSVLSGDTVVLHNINNPKQERTLSLAYVTAPRMRREGDEVCCIPFPPAPHTVHVASDSYNGRTGCIGPSILGSCRTPRR